MSCAASQAPPPASAGSYAFAFVTSAYALALSCGVESARAPLAEACAVWTARLWEPAASLYADVASADWASVDSYRGNNANMHACEAHILAWDATRDPAHLARAAAIAEAMCQRQAARCAHITGGRGPLVYEHFTSDWAAPDVEFHRSGDGVRDRFRPWGFQPGHLAQWAKLLLWLDAREAAAAAAAAGSSAPPPSPTWRLAAARALFDGAWEAAWDSGKGRGGGLVYGFAPVVAADAPASSGDARVPLPWSNEDKYAWVQVRATAGEGGRAGDKYVWCRGGATSHRPRTFPLSRPPQNEAMAAAALLASRLPRGSPERAQAQARYALAAEHSARAYARGGGIIPPPPGSPEAAADPAAGLWLRALQPDCAAPLPGLGAYVSESHYHVVGALLDAAGALEAVAAEAAATGQ